MDIFIHQELSIIFMREEMDHIYTGHFVNVPKGKNINRLNTERLDSNQCINNSANYFKRCIEHSYSCV